MAKRSLNKCKSCGDTWYPKGRDLSRKCHNCGGTDITYAGSSLGCLLLVLIAGGISWAVIGKSCTSNNAVEAGPTPPPAPLSSSAPVPSPSATPVGSPSASPNSAAGEGFPKKVVASKNLTVRLQHGTLGIDRGQAFMIQGRTPEGYQATYGSIKFTVQTGDFQEPVTPRPSP